MSGSTTFTITGTLQPAPLVISFTELPAGVVWDVSGTVTPPAPAAPINLTPTNSDTSGNVTFPAVPTNLSPGETVHVDLAWTGSGSGNADIKLT